MKPRTGIAIGIVGLILYAMIMMMRGDPEERYKQLEQQERMSRSTQAKKPEPQFKSFMAYQLHVEAVDPKTGTSGYAIPDIREALWNELKPHINEPYGLNPDFGQYAGGGSLGMFHVSLVVEERMYKGQGAQSFQTWSIPYYIELTLKVTSKQGRSTWDGSHVVSVTKEPPGSLREGTLSSTRTQHIKKMVKDLVQQIAAKKSFKYYD